VDTGSTNSQNKSPLTFGIYWRKLGFFGSFFIAGLIGVIFISHFNADSADFDYAVYSDNPVSDIYLSQNGKIKIGEVAKDKVNILGDFDEIRTPVIDSPGIYMDQFVVNLHLPDNIDANDIQYEILAIHGVDSTESFISDQRTIVYRAYGIGPSATISVVAKIPKGLITYSALDNLLFSLRSFSLKKWLLFSFLIPLITTSYLVIFLYIKLKQQKVEIPADEVSSLPTSIPPAVAGALYRQKVTAREIAATLVDLAIRGNIFILDRDRDFAFAKNRFDNRLLGYEKILLSKIFTEHVFSNRQQIEQRINDHLYSRKISLYTTGVYALATRLGYFKVNPQTLHGRYRLGGIAAFLLSLVGFLVSFSFSDYPYLSFIWIGMMASSLLFIGLAQKIPIRTDSGRSVTGQWLAFRRYLSSKDKIPFSYDNAELFQRFLPYAIVLDCEVAWAKRFSEQNFVIPKWFVSSKGGFGLQDFCLSLFPIVSYIAQGLSSVREPGFE